MKDEEGIFLGKHALYLLLLIYISCVAVGYFTGWQDSSSRRIAIVKCETEE